MGGDRDLKVEIARQDEADMRARSAEPVDGPPDGAGDRVWLEHGRALKAAGRPGGRVGVPAKVAMVVLLLTVVALGVWARVIGQGTFFGLVVMFGAPILLALFLLVAAAVKLFRGGW